MKIKIVALILVMVFSACIFSGAAWTKNTDKNKKPKSHEYHHNFIWKKIFFRLLKLEKTVYILKQSVSELDRELDAEALEREVADEQLQKDLESETAAREDADADLQEQINSIEMGAINVPIFFTSGPDKADSLRVWRMGIGHLSTDASYGIVTPMSGNLKDLIGYSLLKPDSVDGQFISFEVLVNNLQTGLRCEITGPPNCGNQQILVPVEAGDTLAVLVEASSGIRPTEVGASIVLENTGNQNTTKFNLEEKIFNPE